MEKKSSCLEFREPEPVDWWGSQSSWIAAARYDGLVADLLEKPGAMTERLTKIGEPCRYRAESVFEVTCG